jgi:hypothetical protein
MTKVHGQIGIGRADQTDVGVILMQRSSVVNPRCMANKLLTVMTVMGQDPYFRLGGHQAVSVKSQPPQTAKIGRPAQKAKGDEEDDSKWRRHEHRKRFAHRTGACRASHSGQTDRNIGINEIRDLDVRIGS